MRKILLCTILFFILAGVLGAEKNYIMHIGHSTVLIHLDNVNILTDPNWNGENIILPRSNPPAVKLEDFPRIDAVLISHGHFDHLDVETLKALHKQNKDIKYFLPQNLGGVLEEIGITNYLELKGDRSVMYKGITIRPYQARHSGTRYIFSSLDTSLAFCYLIKGSHTIFFSGDTGYTNLFKKIGEEERIDVAFLEIQGWKVRKISNKGSEKDIPDSDLNREKGYVYTGRHMHPEQAVEAFIDLRAKKFIPIHYDAFFVEFRGDVKILEVLREAARSKKIGDRLLFEKLGTKLYIK
ncbi:MAG: MBL fold metallo-hydrolase [Spirochaetes bacterium]|nr:MBL fold metallo-hydrolase [Spirochaetota bacterium]